MSPRLESALASAYNLGSALFHIAGNPAMVEDPSFQDLLERVRARDEQAAAELVRRFEPAIRVAVRVRLTDPRLRRQIDSMDICQSVLANFFVRAASGQFELERSEQLVNLLVTMARNRLINEAAKHRAARRDQRRMQTGEMDEAALADSEPTPSVVVANRELLDEARGRLTEEERRIADQRAQGRSWAEIAAETGEKPDALRMRFTRALDRVAQELGLEE
jgi:RNA polymerase sigma-70 factor (ECF subfamily)